MHHPIFARFYRLFSGVIEHEAATRRNELLAGLHGRIVEIGAGNGMNFGHYPATTGEVVAIEPEPYLRHLAEREARSARVPVSVRAGVAEALPLPDASCDGAVASLVLCSVQDQARALSELRRVLRPGGELRFLEHARASDTGRAHIQVVLDRTRLWPLVAGGCRCSRDTLGALAQAGFTVERVQIVALGPSWAPTNPVMLGHARASA